MRRITLDSVVPGLKRKVAECTREELLATAEHQRAIEQVHADALARAARSGMAAPPEAYETAWRTHCRAHFYAALAGDLPPGEPVRQHRRKDDLERLWQEACAAAGAAPWQAHAVVVRERETRRNRERRAEAKVAARLEERPDRPARRGKPARGGSLAREPGPKAGRARTAADPAPAERTPRPEGGRPDRGPRPGRHTESATPRGGSGRPSGRRGGHR